MTMNLGTLSVVIIAVAFSFVVAALFGFWMIILYVCLAKSKYTRPDDEENTSLLSVNAIIPYTVDPEFQHDILSDKIIPVHQKERRISDHLSQPDKSFEDRQEKVPEPQVKVELEVQEFKSHDVSEIMTNLQEQNQVEEKKHMSIEEEFEDYEYTEEDIQITNTTKRYLVVALYDYLEPDENQLSFHARDLIWVSDLGSSPDEEWWMGARKSDGVEGYFHKSYVKALKRKIRVTRRVSAAIAKVQKDLRRKSQNFVANPRIREVEKGENNEQVLGNVAEIVAKIEPEKVLEIVPENVAEKMLEKVDEKEPEKVSENVTDNVAENVGEKVIEIVAEKEPEIVDETI